MDALKRILWVYAPTRINAVTKSNSLLLNLTKYLEATPVLCYDWRVLLIRLGKFT
jgi:hypothetical protein